MPRSTRHSTGSAVTSNTKATPKTSKQLKLPFTRTPRNTRSHDVPPTEAKVSVTPTVKIDDDDEADQNNTPGSGNSSSSGGDKLNPIVLEEEDSDVVIEVVSLTDDDDEDEDFDAGKGNAKKRGVKRKPVVKAAAAPKRRVSVRGRKKEQQEDEEVQDSSDEVTVVRSTRSRQAGGKEKVVQEKKVKEKVGKEKAGSARKAVKSKSIPRGNAAKIRTGNQEEEKEKPSPKKRGGRKKTDLPIFLADELKDELDDTPVKKDEDEDGVKQEGSDEEEDYEEYERQRQENIMKNKMLLQQLQLDAASLGIARKPTPVKTKHASASSSKRPPKRKAPVEDFGPRRQSSRLAGLTANSEEAKKLEQDLAAHSTALEEAERAKRARVSGDLKFGGLDLGLRDDGSYTFTDEDANAPIEQDIKDLRQKLGGLNLYDKWYPNGEWPLTLNVESH